MSWNYSSCHPSPLLDGNGQPLSWSLVENNESEDRTNEPIRFCFLGKVFAPIEGRNAWQSTWNETSHPIHPTLSSAMWCTGWSRSKQGTSNYIREYAAIVVAGRRSAVVLVDVWPDSRYSGPFGRCADFVIEGKTSLLDFIGVPFGHVRIWCAKKEATPATLPFNRWHSGRDCWRRSGRLDVDLTHACDFIKRITLHLQAADIASSAYDVD